MRATIPQLIKNELLSNDLDSLILTTCKVSRSYVNKDLIHFIKRVLEESKDIVEREKILIKLKKVIIQTSREFDWDGLGPDPSDFVIFFASIEKEQRFNDPIRFIDSELNCINGLKSLWDKTNGLGQKDWLNQSDMVELFGISITKLNILIAKGLPRHGLGSKALFNRIELDGWLLKQ